MKTVDDETARLVYIFWTETEKGDTRDITFTGSDFTVKSESAPLLWMARWPLSTTRAWMPSSLSVLLTVMTWSP